MMNIDEFKNKKVWAVVGSVSNPEKFAYRIYHFLKDHGYEAYAVDPSGKPVDGETSYRTLSELPVKPEAVDMVINPVRGLDFIEETAKLGIGHIWFQPGAESDEGVGKAEALNLEVVHDRCVMVEFR